MYHAETTLLLPYALLTAAPCHLLPTASLGQRAPNFLPLGLLVGPALGEYVALVK